MDFEFECQFAYITNDGEQQQQQQQQATSDGSAGRAGDGGVGAGSASSNGNEAKRLKQEWIMAMERQAKQISILYRLYMYLVFVDLV